MDKEDRMLVMEIMSDMIKGAHDKFEKEGLEHYLKFKIVCRE